MTWLLLHGTPLSPQVWDEVRTHLNVDAEAPDLTEHLTAARSVLLLAAGLDEVSPPSVMSPFAHPAAFAERLTVADVRSEKGNREPGDHRPIPSTP